MSLEQISTSLGLSELQFALLMIGCGILLLVSILNFLYARARRKSKVQDESFAGERAAREPSFYAADAVVGDRAEPSFSTPSLPAGQTVSNATIDPRIDCVITLRFDEGISGVEILQEINSWDSLQSQAHNTWMCEGLVADLDLPEDWETVRAEATYIELQLAIQLANRRGPIGVLELSDFCSHAQALAETLGAQIDMPSVNTMLESAKELDTMAAESDIQLSINVLFDEACPRANLDSFLRQRGFKLARDGRHYEYLSNGALIFVSTDLDSIQPVAQLTLLLEVPLAAQEDRAFERMLGEGVEIAEQLHGRLVDDNGINLTESAVISIRQHLDILYANLEKSGVPAGSSAASRLFS
ncbi:ZipA, C-terminal FtsZ-binding domain [Polynucleobacter meluiroseus]|uniref:Cell division protein ZipA n=1 Tax=Polynucleobacter meluiroseus TaxID=1938814 RepID=A0A240DZB2_9BURK|nr:cell division protein ZipA C-terminal FtsZ-binding domain-containing protein [Polynucleobacter meluiroseus]SNX28282.1 ZipA, C-terminal FtsZ-binding domain [Polynucleobacter meluiroseus]